MSEPRAGIAMAAPTASITDATYSAQIELPARATTAEATAKTWAKRIIRLGLHRSVIMPAGATKVRNTSDQAASMIAICTDVA